MSRESRHFAGPDGLAHRLLRGILSAREENQQPDRRKRASSAYLRNIRIKQFHLYVLTLPMGPAAPTRARASLALSAGDAHITVVASKKVASRSRDNRTHNRLCACLPARSLATHSHVVAAVGEI